MLAAWLLDGNCAALVMVSARCEAPGQTRGQHLTLHGQGEGECATLHGIMGRRFPDGGLLRYRKGVPQQLGDVNKQWSRDSQPMGARHGDTAANHTDLQSGCGQTCVFAVRVWSNL